MATPCADHAPSGAIAILLADRDRYLAFLCRRVDRGVAEDILQTAYLRILERGISLRDEHRLTSWFYSVLRNAAIDHLRSNTRKKRLRCKLAASAPDPAPTPRVDDDAVNRAAARSLIASLDPMHRDALDTVYVEGGSIAELASKAGITRNAATVRVHRARQALAQLLASSPSTDSR